MGMHTMSAPPLNVLDRAFEEQASRVIPIVGMDLAQGTTALGAELFILYGWQINYSKNTSGTDTCGVWIYPTGLGAAYGNPLIFAHRWERVPTGDATSGYSVSGYHGGYLTHPVIVPPRCTVNSTSGGSSSLLFVRRMPLNVALNLGYVPQWRTW